MIITTTNKYAKIQSGKDAFTYPLNTISYAVNEDSTGITFFRNNEPIGTSAIGKITVDTETLTNDNIEQLLGRLFINCSQTSNGESGNSTQYIAGENITLTSNSDSTVTISANCDSSSSSEFYVSDRSGLPSQASINSLGYITSDGTSQGKCAQIYEYNGFNWMLKSFEPNLRIADYGSADWTIAEPRDQQYNHFLRMKDSEYEYLRIIASDTNNPVALDCNKTLKGMPDIFVNDGNYYFPSLIFSLVDKDTIISNLYKNSNLYIDNDYYQDQSIVKEKNLTIENSDIVSIQVSNNYIKNLTIRNIRLNSQDSEYLHLYFTGAYQNITLENIADPILLSLQEYGVSGIDYGTRTWNFSNLEMYPQSTLSISSLYNPENMDIHTTERISLSNTKIGSYLQIHDAWVSSVSISNVEMYSPEGTARNINMSAVNFTDQQTCNDACSLLGSLLSTGDNFNLSISSNSSNQFKPSQAIVDEMISRGVVATINEY